MSYELRTDMMHTVKLECVQAGSVMQHEHDGLISWATECNKTSVKVINQQLCINTCTVWTKT